MVKVMNCPSGGERDLAVLYLAGRLSDGEAEAFEAHYFTCEACRQDVERGSELRAMLGNPAVTPMAVATRPARTWLPLAAAAVIAFVGLGVWQLSRRAAEETGRSVTRGTLSEALHLEVAAGSQGSVELTWPPHPDAASYRVEVLASDETSVWKTETREPRLSIGPAALPPPAAGQGYRVMVEALDSMGLVIATSEEAAFPKP